MQVYIVMNVCVGDAYPINCFDSYKTTENWIKEYEHRMYKPYKGNDCIQ